MNFSFKGCFSLICIGITDLLKAKETYVGVVRYTTNTETAITTRKGVQQSKGDSFWAPKWINSHFCTQTLENTTST